VAEFAALVRSFLRSPRAFLARVRRVAQEARLEEEVAKGTAAPIPVGDDLPGLMWRRVRAKDAPPVLDVLIPGLQMRHLSGGPNTALNLTYRLGCLGVPLRFVSTDLPADDSEVLLAHCQKLTGLARRPARVSFASWHEPVDANTVGAQDRLLATAWWTAQYANAIGRDVRLAPFIYLIQDFEPGFYKWSTEYALAMETYGFDMQPVICGELLAEYLRANRVGRFADSAVADASLVFEPAIDRSRFYMDGKREAGGPRRLLFYARPEAPRNLFEMGLSALRKAVACGAFDAKRWELWFIGGQVPARDLGGGLVVQQYPWLDYDGYAALLRSCDVGLSLMLSPHTSYPPLEMAACGATVVTNTFANKTAERLAAYSGNLLPVEPSVDGIADGLVLAVERSSDAAARAAGSAVNVPGSWDAAFAAVLPQLLELCGERFREAAGTVRAVE
jgi:O-antigen biosynthesis protein